MVRIEFKPDLSNCIETLAKREYRESLRRCLEGDEEAQEKLELLKLFLESADFGKLRAESEKYLSEGIEVRFILRSEGGKPELQLIVE